MRVQATLQRYSGILFIALLTSATPIVLTGCAGNEKDFDDASDKVEDAADEAGDRAEDAWEDAGDAIEDAGDEIEDATD